MQKRNILVFGLMTMFLLSMFSSATVVSADESLQDVKDAGKIIIGTEAGYAPFETKNPTTNELEGFDVDIANIIADEIGVTIEWQDKGFDTLIPSLAGGQFDCVIAAMTITPEREEQVDFSRWYFASEQAILVKVGNTKTANITKVTDLNQTAITIGVQQGTTSDLYVQDELTQVPSDNLKTFNTITLAIQALKQGSVDVVLGDHATLLYGIKGDEEYSVVGTFSAEKFGIAVKTGATTLLAKINEVLNNLLGDNLTNPEPNKQYNDLYLKYFEVDAVGYETGNTPGFEFLSVFSLLVAVPIIRKLRK